MLKLSGSELAAALVEAEEYEEVKEEQVEKEGVKEPVILRGNLFAVEGKAQLLLQWR